MADFFILGNPRSGTTLFRLMLNSHPDLTVPPECGFSLWLANKYKTSDCSDRACWELFIEDVLNSRKMETWDVSKEEIQKSLMNHSPSSYNELCRCVYLAYAASMNKYPKYVGDKNNYYINKLEKLNNIFPESKKVFIVRDGRDVACSYIKLYRKNSSSEYSPKLKSNIKEIAIEWSKNVDHLVYSVKNYSSKFIRYEDLIKNPGYTLHDVCNFLGVSYNENMLSYNKSNDEPKEFLEWKAKTTEPLDVNRIGVYNHQLTDQQVKLFEHFAGDALKKMGYYVK